MISRKAIDLDILSESQYRQYLGEFLFKYPQGAKISAIQHLFNAENPQTTLVGLILMKKTLQIQCIQEM